MGSYELVDGQALVIEGGSPACAFWNLCLWNPFLHAGAARCSVVTLCTSTACASRTWPGPAFRGRLDRPGRRPAR
jgi:hypothetical protein